MNPHTQVTTMILVPFLQVNFLTIENELPHPGYNHRVTMGATMILKCTVPFFL